MKKQIILVVTVFTLTILFSACGNTSSQKKSQETDSGEKMELKIGEETWMPKNLDVTAFRNGDPIKEAKTVEEWKSACENAEPAFCYYDNNPQYAIKAGVLYNWFAVVDSRGLCPEGWRISSENDWRNLVNSVGGSNLAGIALKSKSGWATETMADNSSGFSAFPTGMRDANGDFLKPDQTAIWWTTTEWIGNKVCTYVLEDGLDFCIDYPANKDVAHAVRCVKE